MIILRRFPSEENVTRTRLHPEQRIISTIGRCLRAGFGDRSTLPYLHGGMERECDDRLFNEPISLLSNLLTISFAARLLSFHLPVFRNSLFG